MTYYLKEEDPPQEPITNDDDEIIWKQGYFTFGDQDRIANITAVKFINSPELLVVAHRAVAKLYLVKIENDFCRIIHSLTLRKNGSYYHPDGMALYEDKLYITTFSHDCPIVQLKDNYTRLEFTNVLKVSNGIPYHGIYIGDQGMFFGGCAPINKKKTHETCIDFFKHKHKKSIQLKTGFNRRIKGIDLLNSKAMIVGSDDKREGYRNLFHSYVHSYSIDNENQKLIPRDDLILKNSQIDGIALSPDKTKWYATVHSADDRCGYIMIGSILKNLNVVLLSKYRCDNFPHGLDVYKDFLSFTCYGSTSFTVMREKDILASAITEEDY